MANFIIEPECLRNSAIFNFGQELFIGGYIVLVFTPPDTVVRIGLPEIFLGSGPVSARGRSFQNTSAGTYDAVSALAIVVSGRTISGLRRASRVVVRVRIPRVHFFSAAKKIYRPIFFSFS